MGREKAVKLMFDMRLESEITVPRAEYDRLLIVIYTAFEKFGGNPDKSVINLIADDFIMRFVPKKNEIINEDIGRMENLESEMVDYFVRRTCWLLQQSPDATSRLYKEVFKRHEIPVHNHLADIKDIRITDGSNDNSPATSVIRCAKKMSRILSARYDWSLMLKLPLERQIINAIQRTSVGKIQKKKCVLSHVTAESQSACWEPLETLVIPKSLRIKVKKLRWSSSPDAACIRLIQFGPKRSITIKGRKILRKLCKQYKMKK